MQLRNIFHCKRSEGAHPFRLAANQVRRGWRAFALISAQGVEGVRKLKTIDLNCDMGEGFGAYAFGQDDRLLPYISSANIACGFHAGDPHIMRNTVERCLEAGVAIGAHPGLPDRLGFGRRELSITAREAYDYLLYQIGALEAFVRAAGARLNHVKPHGALYHMAGHRPELADAVIQAVRAVNPQLMLYAQAGSLLLEHAKAAGLTVAAEAFADRTYQPGGGLTPRSQHGALIVEPEQALRQALSIAQSGMAYTPEGVQVAVRADTICLHGDGSGAAEFARLLQEGLQSAGIRITQPGGSHEL